MNKRRILSLLIIIVYLFSYADDDKKQHGTHSAKEQTFIEKFTSGFDDNSKTKTPTNNSKETATKRGKYHSVQDENEDKFNKKTNTSSNSYVFIQQTSQVERYAHYTMRNGWIEGIGQVNAEQARHMSVYYEFSQKDNEGHWHRIRSLNGYGRPNGEYNFQRIFSNLSYSKATWQWDIVPKKTVEVRISMGTSKGDLIYHYFDSSEEELCKGYSRKLDENSVLMHFFIENSNDTIPLYKNGTAADCELVYCRRDENGFDTYQKFFSHDGGLAVNTDSAFAVIRTYDKRGNRLTDRSLDIMDSPVIDFSGNNGWAATYDMYGNEITSTNMDILWHPMNMPETCDASNRYVRQHCVYDKYCRLTKMYYTDENNKPMTDGYGIASITYKYNDRGQQIENRYWNLKGKSVDSLSYVCCKIIYDNNGYMKSRCYYDKNMKLSENMLSETFKYNSKGQELYYESRDNKQNLSNGDDGDARRITTYNHEGKILQQDKWKVDSLGNLYLTYYRHENKDSIVYYYGYNGTRNIYLKDENGNLCEDYQLNSNGDTIPSGYTKIYYRDVYHRKDEPHKCTYFRARYDKNNRIIFNQDWGESYTIIDSINVTKHYKEYDANKNVTYNSLSCYNKDFDKDKWFKLYHLNSFDIPVWGAQGNFTAYRTIISKNYNDKIVMCKYYNEWDEPAYAVENNKSAYHMIYDAGDGILHYDEFGHICNNCDSLFKILPKAIGIEVTDSTAYRLGIRDNDIVLKYGNWLHKNNWTKENLDTKLYYEAILQSAKEKQLIVLHVDTQKRKTWVEEITLPKGRLSDLGIYPVLRCLTQKENQRITQTWNAYCKKVHNTESSKDSSTYMSKRIVLFIPKKKGYTKLYNDMSIRSPFIALAQDFYPTIKNDSISLKNNITLNKHTKPTSQNQWVIDEANWSMRHVTLLLEDSCKLNMFYTDDFSSTSMMDSLIDTKDLLNDTYRKYLTISEKDYKQLISLKDSLKRNGYQIREIVPENLVIDSISRYRYMPKKIISIWSRMPNHYTMNRADIISEIKKDIHSLGIDINKSKFYGITVDENESPQLVRDYNKLLAQINLDNFTILSRAPSSSKSDQYIWGQKNKKKNSKTVKQLIFYKRNTFIVAEGRFHISW